jgi:signal transduction histidine kinase/ActR/RegA family two-component response regulator
MHKVIELQAVTPSPAASPRTVVFAETSPEARHLYEWVQQELSPLTVAPLELSVWQGLLGTLQGQSGPARVESPLGEGLAMVHRQRGPMRVLAVALQGETPLRVEAAASQLDMIARMALLSLQLKAARTQAATLKQEQERVVRAERLRAQGEVIRSFSHEFNNILATVLLRAEIAVPGVTDERTRECLAAIYESASQGARVLQQLQDFTGLQPRPDQDLLDLGQLVQTFAQERWDELRSVAAVALPQLKTEVVEDLHVMANAADVREVIGNLLDNAREAAGEGGGVRLRVTREKRQAVVRVIDDGPGMEPEQLARACEPFFTTRGGEHLGLGLSVAHGIATRSGGKFALANAEGKGLAVTVSMPLADLRAVRRELRCKRDEEPTLLRNLNVLVVDDEPGMRETLALSLESMGHRVSQAVDGRQAMGLVRYHEGFDALVVDLVMPEVDGWEVAYLARKLQPQAAIVLLTAWGERLGDAAEDRTDAVLAKPVSMKDLNVAICQAVRTKRAETE